MRRIQYHRYGGPDLMSLEEFAPSAPRRYEVAIKVKAASINPIDWKIRRGDLKVVTGRRFPRGMGMDLSGIVTAVGDGVTRMRPGDEVFGMARLKESGSFAEAAITNESFVTRKPPSLSHEEAACLATGGVTAWNGLIGKADIKAGQRVFVHGCTGTVGRAAVQLAIVRGARVVGSCSPASRQAAAELGVSFIFDYNTIDIHELKLTFDVVFDTSGNLDIHDGMKLLRPGGTLLDLHATPGRFLRSFFDKRLKPVICTPTVEILEEIRRASHAGHFHMRVGKSAPFDQSLRLIEDVERGERINGKAVMVMS